MHLPRTARLPSSRRTHVRQFLALLLALLATAATSSAAQSSATTAPAAAAPRFAPGELERRLQRIRQRIESERVDNHIPGVALGVVVDDQVVLLAGFGVADVESGRAVSPETLFAIGSSTKAFTATLCAMLVDEGRLQWDDPITKHVPEFVLHPEPGPGAPWGAEPVVSVRDVLSHRTGFSRNDVLWAGNTVPRETILHTASGAEPWAPYRSEFLYNNVQVMAAGVAAGRIEGTDWDTLVARRLLQPLHMTATNSSVTACANDPQLSLGYAWDAEKQSFRHLPMRNLDAIAPAGSINSNVTDMVQWVRLMLGGGAIDGQRLVSLAALEETWSPQILTGATDSYGLCWFLSEWQGRRVVEHGGNIDGFGAEVALLPDDGIGFVLLTNVSATPLQQTSRGLVFEELLGAERAAPVAEGVDGAPSAAGALEQYVGAYTCNSPGYRDENFHVVVRGDGLAIDVPRQTVYTLRAPNAQGRWVFELTDTIEIDFQRHADGTVAALTMYQGGLALEMPKVGVEQLADEPLEPLARLLGEYAGDGQHLTVVIHNQRLAIDMPGQMIYELRPADEHGLRAFRAMSGFTAEFEERDGVVVALSTHQPNGTFRFERKRPAGAVGKAPATHAEAGDAAATGATAGADGAGADNEAALPDLAAIVALRGASADAAHWEALGGWRLTGGMRFANAGLSGALTSSFRGQTHFHQETDFGPYGFARQASDGTHAWSESVFSPWRELDGNELRQSLQTPANLLGDWRVGFADIRVLRRDEVAGRPAIVVALQDGELPPVTVWVSSDNGDILRVDSAELLPGGQQLPQTITFSDWRDVGGGHGSSGDSGGASVRVPFHSVTKSEATGRIEVQYELAETGLAFPDTLFRIEPPAAPADAAAPAPATEPATAPAPRR